MIYDFNEPVKPKQVRVARSLPLQLFNSSPLKNGAWKFDPSRNWVSVTFQGAKLQEGI